jgi:HD-like signal output (HDOD) protein
MTFQEKVPFEEAERRVLGIDHAEVGGYLLQKWNLPEHLAETIRWHHQPDGFSGETLSVDLVHISDALCLTGGIGAGTDGLNYRLSGEVASRLHLTPEVAESVCCQIVSELDETLDFFTADTGR